jgi:hypothetical protein
MEKLRGDTQTHRQQSDLISFQTEINGDTWIDGQPQADTQTDSQQDDFISVFIF